MKKLGMPSEGYRHSRKITHTEQKISNLPSNTRLSNNRGSLTFLYPFHEGLDYIKLHLLHKAAIHKLREFWNA